jgi:low temperature requirement protein LtrA
VVIAGPALFLLGALLFKFSMFGIWSPARIAGLLLTAALMPLTSHMSPLALAAAAAAILMLVALWETVCALRGEQRPEPVEAE